MIPLPALESRFNRTPNRTAIAQCAAQQGCRPISRPITSGHACVPSFSALLIIKSRARVIFPPANDHGLALLHDHGCPTARRPCMIADGDRPTRRLPYGCLSPSARRAVTSAPADGRLSGAEGDALAVHGDGDGHGDGDARVTLPGDGHRAGVTV
jgi:hypothetical protein